jgi:Zn-dependent peptidase ImmA (M78 family)
MQNAPVSPRQAAQSLVAQQGVSDAFALAKALGVVVQKGQWFPITHGEFDRRTQVITLNERSPVPIEQILAHELGHWWLHTQQIRLPLAEEERWVRDFAQYLPTPTSHF